MGLSLISKYIFYKYFVPLGLFKIIFKLWKSEIFIARIQNNIKKAPAERHILSKNKKGAVRKDAPFFIEFSLIKEKLFPSNQLHNFVINRYILVNSHEFFRTWTVSKNWNWN